MVEHRDAEIGNNNTEIPSDHLFRITGLYANNPQLKNDVDKCELPEGADFEAAISATGYGKFNLILMLFSMPAFLSTTSVTASVTYIFTQAKCDMNLSLVDMGSTNAITYAGMISSAMLWGFLSDTLGRRKLIICGLLMTSLTEMISGLSQNFTMLLITRYIAGFIFNGPFVVMLSYIAELHKSELRAKVMVYSGLFYAMANTALPLYAWFMLKHDWNFVFFNGAFVLRTWNIFMITVALVPLASGIAYIFLPESPKFLMSRGRDEEAMKVFRYIYSKNNTDSSDFTVKYLRAEKSKESARGIAALKAGFVQLLPLFKAPYVLWLFLLCIIHSGIMCGCNTIRLWFPQLAAMLEASDGDGLCNAINNNTHSTIVVDTDCISLDAGANTYLQNSVVGAASILTYLLGGYLINTVGKRRVACAGLVLSSASLLTLPLMGSGKIAEFTSVGLVACILSLSSLASSSLSSVTVDLFPTSLRVMSMAIFLMFGRSGTIIGNLTFPVLLELGCLPPFFAISAVLLVCSIGCLLLPNTTLMRMS